MPDSPSSRIRIKDVALAAGVSVATVSHVYNERGRVSESTRARVRKIGDRLGYQPNQAGQALRNGRSNVLAIAPSFRDPRITEASFMPCFRSLVAGAAAGAAEAGFAVTVARTEADGHVATTLAYDGLIVVDTMPSDPVVEREMRLGRPVVALGGYDRRPGGRVHGVRLGIRDALETYLDTATAAGDDVRPSIFVGPRWDHLTNDAIAGFQRWCAQRGITPQGGALEADESLDAAAARILSGKTPPTMVHCLNESFSAAILRAAERIGLDVPEMLRVTTIGDPRGHGAQRGVDYFVREPHEDGAAAARTLASMVAGETPPDVLLELPLVSVPSANSPYVLA